MSRLSGQEGKGLTQHHTCRSRPYSTSHIQHWELFHLHCRGLRWGELSGYYEIQRSRVLSFIIFMNIAGRKRHLVKRITLPLTRRPSGLGTGQSAILSRSLTAAARYTHEGLAPPKPHACSLGPGSEGECGNGCSQGPI